MEYTSEEFLKPLLDSVFEAESDNEFTSDFSLTTYNTHTEITFDIHHNYGMIENNRITINNNNNVVVRKSMKFFPSIM